MWYYELWYDYDLLWKSIMFETKEEAILQAEREIDKDMGEHEERKYDAYDYELYCTCEDEEII